MRAALVTNPHAGATPDPAPEEIRAALKRVGIECGVCASCGHNLAESIEGALAVHPDAVIAAGGDGTVSSVARALVHRDIPLGVIPSGTLNHFARDLGFSRDWRLAVGELAAATVRTVDVAEVNGEVFINNASIGIYPHIVTKRDQIRERLGRGKFIAMLLACLGVFRRYPTVDVRINSPQLAFARKTPFVFVGNNRYEIAFNNLGARDAIDRGELCVYFTNRTGRFGLFRLALRSIFKRLEQERDFTSLLVDRVQIDTPRKTIAVALDGEVRHLTPPLEFRIVPRALKVLGPR